MFEYKVIASTRPEYVGTRLQLDALSKGDTVTLFGRTFTVVHDGIVITLSDSDSWLLTLQQEGAVSGTGLKFGETVDIFTDVKRISVTTAATCAEVYEYLESVWPMVKVIDGADFPLLLDPDTGNLVIRLGWAFTDDALANISGCKIEMTL